MSVKLQAEVTMPSKEYKPPMPALWWTKNVNLILFMVREITSVFAAGYVLYLLVLLGYLKSGDTAAFDRSLESGFSTFLQVVALIFVIYHSITWFNLLPDHGGVRGREKESVVDCAPITAVADHVARGGIRDLPPL